MENSKQLDNACWENTIEFTPLVFSGKVIKVYDGDTITIASKMPYNCDLKECDILYRFHIRLLGVDTPEIKSKNEIDEYNNNKELLLLLLLCFYEIWKNYHRKF